MEHINPEPVPDWDQRQAHLIKSLKITKQQYRRRYLDDPYKTITVLLEERTKYLESPPYSKENNPINVYDARTKDAKIYAHYAKLAWRTISLKYHDKTTCWSGIMDLMQSLMRDMK